MKKLFTLLFLCFAAILLFAQANPEEIAKIRQQMAKIRQSTNWNDPAAAKKANSEIQKLAQQITGGNSLPIQFTDQPNDTNSKPENVNFELKTEVTQANIIAIAERFFNRSYKNLDAVAKSQFDQDYKVAQIAKFSLESVRKLTSKGAALITFGNDHFVACVYLTSAVKAFSSDTLCINNFGAYLRAIDSTAISIPVLLYANKIFSKSPVILTQLGYSYYELGDLIKAESYFKAAISVNPGFGQAHSALCDLYIKQNRLQDAIVELFAGVKGMGASYMQASQNLMSIQQNYSNNSGEGDSKQEFWGEAKKHLNPDDVLAPLVPEESHVKIPNFPNCSKVEDWQEGGGYSSAVSSFQSFHAYMMSFAKQFLDIHKQAPDIPADATLRDYPNERFALDCITEMFANFSYQEGKKYHKSIDEITQRVNDAKEIYIKNYGDYAKEYSKCVEGCSDEYCFKECHRKYCSKECPNANKFNDILRQGYKDYRSEFTAMVGKQTKLLDDLYAFANPWLTKINSPYWSKIYAYEIKRVALGIAGNCYGAYPQPFQGLAHNDCGEDCSIYVNPYPEKPDEVNKKDPKGNECPEDSKHILHLLFCEASLTCEYWEIGCTEGVSASVRRNFGKNKSTTIFLGAGLEAGLGAVGASAKFGGQMTFGDNGSVDGGFRGSVSGELPVGNKGYNGAESEFTLTAMEGYKSESYKVSSKGIKEMPGE
jgi:tetratricopeptide (TPR) repeat protein